MSETISFFTIENTRTLGNTPKEMFSAFRVELNLNETNRVIAFWIMKKTGIERFDYDQAVFTLVAETGGARTSHIR